VLDRVVATAVESCRSIIAGRSQSLTVNMPGEPVELQADPQRLAQVLTNLLNNAAKFTGNGGNIWLTAERDKANNQGAISITDTGDGIPAELMPRIFDIFAQGDQSLERTRGGLGLGLALVRSLTEMQGGTVEAQSPGLGQGSTFTIHMPLAPPGARSEDRPAQA